MPKKVIQVPIEQELLHALDLLSKKRCQSRSELIREACQRYLRQIESEQLDEVYKEGYRRLPEESSLGQGQVSIATQILPQESW